MLYLQEDSIIKQGFGALYGGSGPVLDGIYDKMWQVISGILCHLLPGSYALEAEFPVAGAVTGFPDADKITAKTVMPVGS